MAFNNSNRSLASQRFINSINAIVIQENWDWWSSPWMKAIWGYSAASVILLYVIWKKANQRCAELFEKLLKEKRMLIHDHESGRNIPMRPGDLGAAIKHVINISCEKIPGMRQYIKDILWKHEGKRIDDALNSLLKILSEMNRQGCDPQKILELLKIQVGEGVLTEEEWAELGQKLSLEGVSAAMAALALVLEGLYNGAKVCAGVCSSAVVYALYLRNKFPNVPWQTIDQISTYLMLIIALMAAIAIITASGGTVGAAILADLAAARAGLSVAVATAGILPPGIGADSFIDSLLGEVKELDCATPTGDATDEGNSTDEDTTPPDGNPPGGGTPPEGGTPPGGGTLPAGGMPPASYKPNSTAPTTNSNASRQIFNRKLR